MSGYHGHFIIFVQSLSFQDTSKLSSISISHSLFMEQEQSHSRKSRKIMFLSFHKKITAIMYFFVDYQFLKFFGFGESAVIQFCRHRSWITYIAVFVVGLEWKTKKKKVLSLISKTFSWWGQASILLSFRASFNCQCTNFAPVFWYPNSLTGSWMSWRHAA